MSSTRFGSVIIVFSLLQRTAFMRVKDILQEKGAGVVTINASQSIHAAIVKLNDHSLGALIVTGEDGEIAGIVTERDILRNCGSYCGRLKEPYPRGETACPYLVKEVMTKDLVIGVPDDDLNYVMGVMTKNRVRHLPILDNGHLAGIISMSDLVNAHLEEHVFQNRTLKDYIQGWARQHEAKSS